MWIPEDQWLSTWERDWWQSLWCPQLWKWASIGDGLDPAFACIDGVALLSCSFSGAGRTWLFQVFEYCFASGKQKWVRTPADTLHSHRLHFWLILINCSLIHHFFHLSEMWASWLMLLLFSLDVRKKQTYTNVHEAVKAGDVEQLALMVKRGASIDEVDSVHKFTPLHCAAHSGSLEVKS